MARGRAGVTAWYEDRDDFIDYVAGRTNHDVAREYGVSESTIRKWRKRHGIEPSRDRGAANVKPLVRVDNPDDTVFLAALKKLGDAASIEEVADECDIPPKRVREAAARLGHKGFRVEASDNRVMLHRVPVPSNAEHRVLFDGETYRFGIASDVHTSSKHCRLDELHMAYDMFVDEGITTVYNPGDIVAGKGIYRTQSYDITRHTFEDQVDGAVEEYPARPTIVTRVVGGNHDQEGDFAKAGANAALAVCNRRGDMVYDGDYDATYTLPQGTRITVRHPQGGKGYAKSYKPQKFAEAFEGGTKPNVLILGHYHDAGFFPTRNIQILMAGTFEGNSTLALRVPLGEPAIGFWIVEMRVADDGSVVRFNPEWFPFYAGRQVSRKAA